MNGNALVVICFHEEIGKFPPCKTKNRLRDYFRSHASEDFMEKIFLAANEKTMKNTKFIPILSYF